MKKRQTNFPKAGDDEKISLRNSNYPRFPLDFAIAMKDNTPKIWGAGGNIEGNRSFRLLREVLSSILSKFKLCSSNKYVSKELNSLLGNIKKTILK